MNRRSYLGIVGAASVATFAMGRAGAGPSEDDYGRVMNIEEAGADSSGEEPIDDVFAEQAQDDTLLKFPPGEYRANQLSVYQLSNFAMVGEDATLVPGDDYTADPWLGGAEVDDVRIENFTIDNTADGVAPEIGLSTVSELVIRDVVKRGYHSGTGIAIGLRTLADDSEIVLENVQAPDGGKAVGIYGDGTGPMRFRNCQVQGFTNNGLYASNVEAPVTVDGGLFKDNNIAQVRLGSADSSITNARLEVTRPVKGPDSDIVNMRGIRIADGTGPVTVDNCDIWLRGSQGTGGIVTAYSGGSLNVVDSRIYVDPEYTMPSSDGARTSLGIFVDNENGAPEGSRSFRNVSITGGGRQYGAIRIRRSNNVFEGVCINQSGDTRNGIILENSSNNTLTDSTIDVPDKELVLSDSSVKKANLSTSGSCPAPTTDDGDEDTDSTTETPTEEDTPDSETPTEDSEQTPTEDSEQTPTEDSEQTPTEDTEQTPTETPTETPDSADETTQTSASDDEGAATAGNSTSSTSGTKEAAGDDEDDCQLTD